MSRVRARTGPAGVPDYCPSRWLALCKVYFPATHGTPSPVVPVTGAGALMVRA
jgi:hypothetical protein